MRQCDIAFYFEKIVLAALKLCSPKMIGLKTSDAWEMAVSRS